MGMPDDHPFLFEITRAVRQADEWFEESGGSSRHWVRECFVHCLEKEGLEIRKRIEDEEPEDLRVLIDIADEVLGVMSNEFHNQHLLEEYKANLTVGQVMRFHAALLPFIKEPGKKWAKHLPEKK